MNTIAAQAQEPKRTLIVIDIQENLLKPTSRLHMENSKVDPFIKSVNAAVAEFAEHQHAVIYTVNEWTNPVVNFFTGNVCKKGSAGTAIAKEVKIVSTKVYNKSKNDAFSNKALSEFLRTSGTEELYIVGLFAEACIQATVRAALKNHYKVFVVEDAVGSRSEKKKLRSLKRCIKLGATITSSPAL
jgi:nicotinamidase-related amidase